MKGKQLNIFKNLYSIYGLGKKTITNIYSFVGINTKTYPKAVKKLQQKKILKKLKKKILGKPLKKYILDRLKFYFEIRS
jgi:ribosomal protein S13